MFLQLPAAAGTFDQAPALQRRSWFLRAGDTVETNRAAQRFSAIRMRSLNDPRQGSLPPALLHLESGANGFRRSGADRETRYTLEPRRDICMRCKPSHPSPSARGQDRQARLFRFVQVLSDRGNDAHD